MWFSVCSSDKKCICRDGYVEINRGTCVLQLEKICRINRQCRIPHSVCENGQCECEPKFLNIANKQCVLSKLRKFFQLYSPWLKEILKND